MSASSIHGLRYVGEDKSGVVRALWLVCVLISAAAAGFFIVQNVRNFRHQPSVVSSVQYVLSETVRMLCALCN